MNRCINDIFGYCSGTPKGQKYDSTLIEEYSEVPLATLPYLLDSCTHDPKTCRLYKTSTQLIARFKRQHPSRCLK